MKNTIPQAFHQAVHQTARTFLMTLAVLGSFQIQSAKAVDYTAELAAVAALGTDAAMLAAPAIYSDDATPGTTTTVVAGDLKVIYFDALDYLGNPTRVYAWVGIPTGATVGSPVPGMVLVHGGGGSASQAWVEKWTERGYAAISISVEGQKASSGDFHNMPGPTRAGTYGDTGVSPISDQWMYHAVADCVLANSLLRSFPEVNAAQVGLSGFSWGGVITSTVIGIDNRFNLAIPTYGCGHLYDARNHYGAQLGNNDVYKEVWDPMIRMANATMPVLWFSWPEEPHFPMDSLAYSYHAAPGTRMVSLKPGMGHGGNFNSPESYDFADSIVSTGTPWCVQNSVSVSGTTATVVFTSTKALLSADLVYTTGNDAITTDISTNLVWTETALSAPVESPAGTWTVTATLPAGVTGWFVNVKATGSDTGDLYGYTTAEITASSDYQEIITASLNPSGSLAIEHPLVDDQSTGIVDVTYTGPANIEISSITITGESHAGSFSSLTTAPLVQLTPSPDTTPVTIQFDNTVAGLTDGQTATATLTIVWDELDGSTDQITLPLSATAQTAVTVVYDASTDLASQDINDVDNVIIRNGATVTVGEFVEPNLVVNGSFEAPDSPDLAYNGIASYGVGNASLSNWTISGSGVWLIDSWNRFGNEANTVAADGDQYLQLQDSGTGAATITQDITTEVGATYRLTFGYSGVDTGTHSVDLNYSAGGPTQTVTYNTGTPMQAWQTATYDFQATSATTSISFTGDSVGGGFYGVGLDKVIVVKITEPNLIVNGSFEAPDATAGSFSQLAAGNTSLTGWAIADSGQKAAIGGVVVIDHWDTGQGAEPNTSAPSDGDQFLQLQHSSGDAGIVSQTFATEVGANYQLEFDYSAVDFGARSSTITYDVGGPDQTVTFTSQAGQKPWATESYQFTATATTTTLSFEGSHFSGFWGVSIDDVSVRILPATSDISDTIIVNDDASPLTATLDINQDFALTATTSIVLGAGTGAGFVNQSNGTVTTASLTINSSGTGDASQYNLSGGSLEAAATLVNNAGELNFTGGLMKSDGTITLSSGGTFSVNRSDTITQGTDFGGGGISGAGAFVKNGSGMLVLNVANTYTGGTAVNAGLLDLVGQNRIDGAIIVDGTSTIKLSGTSHNAMQSFDAITLQNGGTFTDNTQGGFVQSVNPLVTFNNGGTMTSEAGANGTGGFGNFLFINGINVTGTGLATISSNGISFNFGETITVADTVAGDGTDLLISSSIKNDRVGTNIKAGVGTLTLTGINTDTSPWSITGGTLEIGGAGQLQSGSYANTIANSGTFEYNSTANQTMSGVISGSGNLVKDNTGTLTLTSANTYIGATTINAGILSLGNGTNNTTLADASDIVIATGAVLNLNFTGTDSIDELFLGGLQMASGTWGATGSGATHIDDTYFTGTGTLTVGVDGPAYDAWAYVETLTGADIDINADPDADGRDNLYEFAFGTSPTSKTDTSKPFTFDGTTLTITRREGVAAGVTYILEESTTLESNDWSTVSNTTITPVSSANGFETIDVTKSVGDWASGTRNFLRLRVLQTP